jgi:hypothetical protein
MRENVGRVDQVARWIAGPALMSLGYRRLGGRRGRKAGLAAMVGGALLVESATTRVCPLNALMGIDSRSEVERARDRRAALADDARIDADQISQREVEASRHGGRET